MRKSGLLSGRQASQTRSDHSRVNPRPLLALARCPLRSPKRQYSIIPSEDMLFSDLIENKPPPAAENDKGRSRRSSSTKVEYSTKEIPTPWVSGRVPSGWWNDPERHRQYLDWLGEKLGFKSNDDWYRVTLEDFKRNGGLSLLWKYNCSPSKLVSSVYSDHEFFPWLFARTTRKYFNDRNNRREYIKWLVERVDVKSESELKYEHFLEHGGSSLLVKYNNSPLEIINSTLEENSTESPHVSLKRKPRGYWSSIDTQRKFLDEIGEKIGVRDGDLSPWYSLSVQDFIKHGGVVLINIYHSLFPMLSKVYSDYKWIPWKFERTPKNHKDDPEVLRNALAEVERDLKILRNEDWYRVSGKQLEDIGMRYFLTKKQKLIALLRTYRPDFEWDEAKLLNVADSGRRARAKKVVKPAQI